MTVRIQRQKPESPTRALPVQTVQGAVLHRFGNIFGSDVFPAIKIGHCPRNPQDAVVGSGTQVQTTDGGFQNP